MTDEPYANGTLPVEVRTVGEFVSVALEARRTMNARRVWFRGQGNAIWPLLPSAYRDGVAFDEKSAFNVFISRGRALPEFSHLRPEDCWDWYFAARHHALLTRLLDWSANPMTALYFALTSAKDGSKPRVWILNPIAMNVATYGDALVYMPDESFTNHWLPDSVTAEARFTFPYEGKSFDNEKPLAMYPAYANPRLVAQAGFFTLHGASKLPLDAQCPRKHHGNLLWTTVDIEPAAVRPLLDELEHLNVNCFSIFPDGDRLAEHLNRFFTE